MVSKRFLPSLNICLNFYLGHLENIEFAGNYIERELLDPLTTAFETFSTDMKKGVDKGN